MAHEFEEISVVQINAGDEEGADITLEINSVRFAISVFASSLSDGDCLMPDSPTEDLVIRLLNEAVTAADEDYEDLVDEILDIILRVGGSTLAEAAPPKRQSPTTAHDLQSLLYPERLDFRLQTIKGKESIFKIGPYEGVSLPDTPPEPFIDTDFQPSDELSRYLATDILVQDIIVRGNGLVGRVHVHGQDMLCKARKVGLLDDTLNRELTTLQCITEATARARVTIRAPRLHGYVVHSKSGAIIGLLRQWVSSSARGKTLRDIDMATVPLSIRQQWADQIRQAVAVLHGLGIIWGDGKPSNVVVDENDDVALIDFAGGWSRGWVDEELAETKEGDNQALERIVQFLGV